MIRPLRSLARRTGEALEDARSRVVGVVGDLVDTGASLAQNAAGTAAAALSGAGNILLTGAGSIVLAPLRGVLDPGGTETETPDEGRSGPDEDLADRSRRLLAALLGNSRGVWVAGGRAHIQVSRELTGDDERAGTLERDVETLSGVLWARVNPLLRVVIVSFDDDAPNLRRIVSVVDDLDTDWEGAHANRDVPAHPADPAPLVRQLLALGADVTSLGLAAAGRLAHLPALPPGLTMLVSVVEYNPRLRRLVESRLGAPVADLTLSVLSALVQALGQGPMGPALDIPYRASLAAEVLARRAVWLAREPSLCDEPAKLPRARTLGQPRPVDLPPGPIERYADAAWFASVSGAGLSIPLTRSFEQASAVLSVGLPKAARLGREAFVAHLGRVLARRGILVMNPDALRLLDRVDTLVVEEELLQAEDMLLLGEILPLAGLQRDQVELRVGELFDPERPEAHQRHGEWMLAPLGATGHEPSAETRARAGQLRLGAAPVLTLTRDDATVALVQTRLERSPAADRLLTAARDAGLRVAVATDKALAEGAWEADEVLPSGPGLTGAVRDLQEDGRVVCLVGGADRTALLAADCGVGMCRAGYPPPWVSDLLCGHRLEEAVVIVQACASAREVSRRSVQFAAGGAAAGSFFLFRRTPAGTTFILAAVNLASLGALGLGSWLGSQVGRRAGAGTGAWVSGVPWHMLSPNRVLARLESSPRGLPAEEADRRRDPIPRSLPAPLLLGRLVLEELDSPLTPVLAGGATLSGIAGSAGDAGMIAGVVLLNAALGGAQRFRTERAIAALKGSSHPVRVRRGESTEEVDPDQLVPGDVIELEAGEVVPADCRILESWGLEVDEAALTGESLTVAKSPEPSLASALAERTSMVFEGTFVAAGTTTAVVVAVGAATEARRALVGAKDERAKTGVEARLDALTALAIPAALASSLGVVGAGVLRGQPLRDALRGGVSLAAAAVPEGLPLLATAAQLASAQRLSARGAVVRDPRAIEALGRVTMLCADKTGTLTQGRLALRAISDGTREERLDGLGPSTRRVLAAALRATPPEARENGLPHPTDQVVVEGARDADVGVEEDAPGWQRQAELPFEPARGYHATLGRSPRRVLLSLKGAPEVLLPRCTAHGWGDDPASDLDDGGRQRLEEEVDRFARHGYRVLAVVERDLPEDTEDMQEAHVEELTFLGFLLISDPVRPTAASAIAGLHRAGVQVTMITGDHPSTAEGVAADLGLLNGYRVASGPDIEALDDEELDKLLSDVRVFARVTPAHKVRIVQGFQRLGHLVAMTGDGANDAPAIRLAEVGIALGERATTAARDAADLVVLDDRIETIVDAIVEGRAMWAAVREAVAILVGGNVGEIVFTLGAGLLTGASPLNPRQLLLVNLVTDVLPAMAVALRSPGELSHQDLLNEGPDASLGQALNRTILWRAVATTGGAAGAWIVGRGTGTPQRASTVALVGLVFSQLGQTLSVAWRSPTVAGASLGSAALLAAIVQTPGVSQVFGCRPLGPAGWVTATGSAAAATVAAVVLPRLLPDPETQIG